MEIIVLDLKAYSTDPMLIYTICTKPSFYYYYWYYQTVSVFFFLVHIRAFVIFNLAGIPSLYMKGKTKWILFVVVK